MSIKQVNRSLRQMPNLDENPKSSVHNYYKLMKMKKLLADTESKMFNRIKLFQKASEKLLKKKQQEMKVFEKLESIKKDPIFFRTQQRPKTRDSVQRPQSRVTQLKKVRSNQNLFEHLLSQHRDSQATHSQSSHKILAERINEERIKNARLMKEDWQRNKIIIEQRKKKELTRKLQSANMIRRERENAKIVKEQVISQKHDDFKKFMEEKYEREKEGIVKMQLHLQELQEKEKQALITWKRTVQS